MSLLVPIREWPVFAWSFLAYLLWMYCVPYPLRLESRLGMWLLSWCGYYSFHPCHDGMSMDDVSRARAALEKKDER